MNDSGPAYQYLAHVADVDSLHSESLLQTATGYWLYPATRIFPNSQTVIRKLISVVEKNHNDRWLEDFVNSPRSRPGMKLLRSAISLNESGDYQQSEADARSAEKLFTRAANVAGAARSRYELVYALHRQSMGQQCLLEGQQLTPVAQSRQYSWIETQLLIEMAICQGLINDFGQETRFIDRAMEAAKRFQYPSLQLRALGIAASFDTSEGRLKQSWNRNEQGLNLFWENSYPALRGYQFYSGLGFAARQTGDWGLAEALQHEAVVILEEESGHLDFKASAYFEFGAAAEMAGDNQTAQEEFKKAHGFFKQLETNPRTPRIYEANAQIALAELEAGQGLIQPALQRLNGVRSDIRRIRNFNMRLSYWKARAEVERRRKDQRQEQNYLDHAVAIGRQGFSTLRSEKERWDWRRMVGPAFSRLLEFEISRPHDPAQALADWESVHAGETQGNFPAQIVGNARARKSILRRAKGLTDSTLVSFAVFGNTVLIWTADNRGVREFKTTDDSGRLQQEIREFFALCSDSHSSLAETKIHGAWLYKRLIAPTEDTIRDRNVIFIEADGPLSAIPWPALVTASGEFLGQSRTIINTSGLPGRSRRPARLSGQKQRTMVVIPGAVTFHGVQYPPLPDAEMEARMISALYPKSIPLRNRQATAAQLLQELPGISIFHFAGHGVSYDYGGALLLGGRDGQETLSSATLAGVRLHRCKLVVLSACSTATARQDVLRDPYGLVRAFLAAGAQRVIASHWDVNSDATARLMEYFYRALHQGKPAPDALRIAREKLRLEPEMERPYYWAAFEIFGPVE